jgi:4-amino-4-deoxy-L-arabinose transferase-like glycosyltransferase
MSSTPTVVPDIAKTSVKARPGKQGGTLLGLILGAILLDFLYCKHMQTGLVNPDAMDFAQCARNLLQGHGFTTQILHPLALNSVSHLLHQPDMTHGILYPFLLAIGFGISGAKDAVVTAVSGLFYVLTVPLIYVLGRRLFNVKVGGIAALIFLTNGTILDYAASGTDITLFLFLATCLFYALHTMASSARGKEETVSLPKAAILLAGFMTGMLYLTDPLFLWIVPVLIVAVAKMYPQRPVSALLWFGAPLLALLIPSMARFGMLTGNPFFGLRGAELWMGTEMHPGLLGYRLSADQFASDRGTGSALARKLILATVDDIALLPRMPGSWILLFVAPSLVYQYSNPSATRLRSIVLWSLLAMLVGGLFFSPNPIRLMIVFPALLIYAVAFLQHTLDAARLTQGKVWMVSASLGLVLLSPLVGDLIKTRYPAMVPEAGTARALTRQIPAGEVSFSDRPWLAAWYGDRASIWIPAEDGTLADLRRQFPQARWLFLTQQADGLSPEWDQIYRGLLGWNQQYYRAQEAHAPLPPSVRISGGQIPLLKALDGFETVPPIGTEMPSVVVAEAPLASQQPAHP